MKKSLVVAAALLAFSGTSFGFHCPADIAKIDEILAAMPDLDSEVVVQVKELRDKGEQLHNAGDHAASVDVLAQALELLEVQ